MGTYTHSINWKGRRGLAVLEGGVSGPPRVWVVASAIVFKQTWRAGLRLE